MLIIAVMGIFFVEMMLIFYQKTKQIFLSCVSGFIMLHAGIVAVAEITGLFSAYACTVVVACFALVDFMAFCLLLRFLPNGITELRTDIWVRIKSLKAAEWMFFTGFTIILMIAAAKNLAYPPINTDSLNFHCVRAFMYWKNRSLQNFSFSLPQALYYYPPLNAILMSISMMAANGDDWLMNFIQFPSWVCAVGCTGKIAAWLIGRICDKEHRSILIAGKYIAMLAMVSVPMSLFQISTTQNDLLPASFSIIAAYYLFFAMSGQHEIRYLLCILAGLAGGLAFLSKMTCAPMLLFSGLFFIAYIWNKWEKKEVLAGLALISICGIMMNLGFWVRNAVDLNGDFLGVTAISSMFGNTVQPFLYKAILNFGYALGSNDPNWAGLTQKVVHLFGNLFYKGDVAFETFDCFYLVNNNEVTTYPFHIMLIVFAAIFLFIYALRRKKGILAGYVCCAVCIWVVNAGSMTALRYSARYLLPSLFFSIPLISAAAAICMQSMCKTVFRMHKRVASIAVCLLMLPVFGYSFLVQGTDSYMVIPFKDFTKLPHYEKHYYESPIYTQPVMETYLSIIKGNHYKNIGMYGDCYTTYPLVYFTKDEAYRFEYLYPDDQNKHQPDDYVPDCIIYKGSLGEYPQKFYYGADVYSPATEAFVHQGLNMETLLYVKE